MPTFPNGTGPALQTKLTSYDATTNTSSHWNGADANNLKTIASASKAILAGSYRGYCHRRTSGNLTAVTVHTIQALVNGYRKTVASARVLIPGVTGTQFVYCRGNVTGLAMAIRTAATEPAPYATSTRDFPVAKVTITGGLMTIEQTRPDWIIGGWA